MACIPRELSWTDYDPYNLACPSKQKETVQVWKKETFFDENKWMIRNERLFGPGAGEISKALGFD